jgi:predicted permease
MVATLGCGVLFGTLPALRATRHDLIGAIKAGAVNSRRSIISADNAMVAVQAGLSLVLLFAGTLLAQTLTNLRTTPLGFRPDGLLYARVEPRTGGIPAARRGGYFEQAVGHVAAIPEVASVSATDDPPLNVQAAIFSDRQFPICTPGYVPVTTADAGVDTSSVGPRFFKTIGTPLRSGREFEWRDGVPNAPAVAIVNESFVRTFFAGKDPLAQRFGFRCPANPTAVAIVGVVADAKNSPRQVVRPRVYFPLGDTGNVVTLVIRTGAMPESLILTIRRVMTEFNIAVPTFGEITPIALREQQMRQERMLAGVVLVFGGVALVLAAIGIYGMLGYLVLRRTREIGIRLAIGAQPAHIAVDVLRAAVVPVSVGLGIGCLVGIAAATWAERLLFGVSAHNPMAMAIGIVVLLGIAIVAAAMPAKRAAQTDPLRALRFE